MNRAIQIVTAAPKVARKTRSPQHAFLLRQAPWEIQPFMLAPVLPGETLKNALVQARVESPLVTSSRTGWWYEMYFFYVKHRDMMDDDGTYVPADTMVEMHMGDATPPANVTPSNALHEAVGGSQFTRWCLNSVVHHYFRSEGEEIWGEYASEALPAPINKASLPLASILQNSYLDSLTTDTDGENPTEDLLPGEYPHLPDFVDPMFASYYQQWERMTAQGFYQADFADYLRSHGVRPPRELLKHTETLRPELIRYIKDWKMPVPSMTGGTTGFNVRWDIAERMDKDRFFAEPGFIFGVAVARPKIYFGGLVGSFAEHMRTPYAWLPAVLNDEAYTSLMKFESGTGPIPESLEDYWLDVKDLFLYGDTFVNFSKETVVEDLTDPENPIFGWNPEERHVIALPTAELRRRYIAASAVEQFGQFVTTAAVPYIEVDGVCNLDIMSRIHDTSGHAMDPTSQQQAIADLPGPFAGGGGGGGPE